MMNLRGVGFPGRREVGKHIRVVMLEKGGGGGGGLCIVCTKKLEFEKINLKLSLLHSPLTVLQLGVHFISAVGVFTLTSTML